MRDAILSVRDVAVSFGGIHALQGASFDVRKGSITGLIGPNGAGKTTLFDIITGFTRPDAGQVLHKGRRIDGLPPYLIARRGIGRTFQLIRLMPSMTALENLLVAQPNQAGETLAGGLTGAWRREERANEAACQEIIESLQLGHRQDVPAGQLSYGQQKLVEIARVLSLNAELILLDEPMAGVNPVMRNQILETVHRLSKKGKTFIIIEHDLEMVMRHCDEVVVLDQGQRLAQGTPDEVGADPDVIAAYMGVRPKSASTSTRTSMEAD